MVNNMTEGKPLKLLFFFAVPMVVGNLFQQLYNMVDSMVVGRFVGEDALAAVGSSFPIVFLSVAIAAGLSMGCTVVISQFFGAGKIREMKVTVSTALISLGMIGVLIMGAGELISDPLLRILGTSSEIMADSLTYLRIYFGGAVFLFLYNSLNGIYNALGDSHTPLKFLIVSALMNIGLDLLFVIQFHMGVAGVAWATLIAQGVCAFASFFVLVRRLKRMENEESASGLTFTFFDKSAAKHIAKVGIPSMIQQSILSFSMMMMQGLVNSYGKVFVAGYTAATKIDTLAMLPNMNFSNAMSSYAAQNIGAGKTERVKEGYKASMLMVVIFSLLITGIIHLWGPELLGLFLEQGESGSAMSYGLDYMKTVSLFYILMGALYVGNGLLRGAGDMGAFMWISMANLFSRVVLAYLMAHFIGESAIWWSIPTGWAVGFTLSFIRVKRGKWMTRSLVN